MRPIGSQEELERRRMNAYTLLTLGRKGAEIAGLYNVTERTVSRWKKSARHGLKGLKSKGRHGPKPFLSKERLNEIKQHLGNQIFHGIKMKRQQETRKFKMKFLQGFIEKKYGRRFHRTYIYRLIDLLRKVL